MPFRRILSAALCLLLVAGCLSALGGCAPGLPLPPEPDWEKNARAQIEQAEELFAKRQYEQAAKSAEAFETLYPKSRSMDRALNLLGEVRLTQRDYRQALSYYKDLIEKYPASTLVNEAKYKLGLCYFELKEYDLAAANLDDRSRIADPVRLNRIAEMLSVAYAAKKNYPLALREYLYLAGHAQNERQQAGYRDRIRELIDRDLAEGELSALAAGAAYPSDIARLRLAALLIEKREFREAAGQCKSFLEQFPNHPERIRAEMLLNEATAGLSAPRYFVGALLPQSGPLAFFGDRVLKGIQLAEHAYNLENPDNRVEVVVKDTEGSPSKAAAAIDELAARGVVAAIGPITTREEEALAPALEKRPLTVLRPAASRAGFTFKSPWIFRDALTIDSQARAAAQYALSINAKKIVILYPDDPYGKDLSVLFGRELERKAEVLASLAYPPDTKDFGPLVRRLLEIDFRSRKVLLPDDEAERKKLFAEYTPSFDALYLPGYAESVGLLIPQLAFYNISGKPLIGSDNWHSPELLNRAGRYAEGAVFVDGFFPESTDPAIKAMVESYRSAYQSDPDLLAAQAYDSAMIIFSLLRERKDTAAAIRDGLLSLKDYRGITGLTTFGGMQEAQKKLFLIKVENGAFTLAN